MKLIKRLLRKIWPRYQVNEIQVAEELMQDFYFMEQAKLNELLAERERLRKAKKKHSHLNEEINRLKCLELVRSMG